MRNPVRRNKNMGKTQGGRVKDGRASEKWSRMFPENKWQQISNGNLIWQTFVENPSKNYYHPCKPEDYLEVLQRLPARHTIGVKGIILRRIPKRDLKLGIDAWRRWSCIIMNCFPLSKRYVYSRKPPESVFTFYEPFCSNWMEENDSWILNWDDEGVRRYYLYHVFLHELGHIFDKRSTSQIKREKYADSFARDMAESLGER